MSLFVLTKNRQVVISDAYVMAVAFLLTFLITWLAKRAILKYGKKRAQKEVMNLRGGDFDFKTLELSQGVLQSETGKILEVCAKEGLALLVKDPRIARMIALMTKETIKGGASIVISPNLARFIATRLNRGNTIGAVKFRDILIGSDSPPRLLFRTMSSVVMGGIAHLNGGLGHAILMLVFVFEATINCGIPCGNYFSQITESDNKELVVYTEPHVPTVIIAPEDKVDRIQLYQPIREKSLVKTYDSSTKEKADSSTVVVQQTYQKVKRKAKLVRFSDFQKTDPELRRFHELKEPFIPEKSCPSVDDFLDP